MGVPSTGLAMQMVQLAARTEPPLRLTAVPVPVGTPVVGLRPDDAREWYIPSWGRAAPDERVHAVVALNCELLGNGVVG